MFFCFVVKTNKNKKPKYQGVGKKIIKLLAVKLLTCGRWSVGGWVWLVGWLVSVGVKLEDLGSRNTNEFSLLASCACNLHWSPEWKGRLDSGMARNRGINHIRNQMVNIAQLVKNTLWFKVFNCTQFLGLFELASLCKKAKSHRDMCGQWHVFEIFQGGLFRNIIKNILTFRKLY